MADLAPPRQAPQPVDGGVTFGCAANTLTLIVSGMGTKKAMDAAQAALNGADDQAAVTASRAAKPEAILVTGLCGGLTESLSEGRFVAYTNCLPTDPTRPPISSNPQVTSRIVQVQRASRGA